jgi:hypothetical protein
VSYHQNDVLLIRAVRTYEWFKGPIMAKPKRELSIEQLKRIAWFLGYELVCTDFGVSLYDERNGQIAAQDDVALSYLRTKYVEQRLDDALEPISVA